MLWEKEKLLVTFFPTFKMTSFFDKEEIYVETEVLKNMRKRLSKIVRSYAFTDIWVLYDFLSICNCRKEKS